MNPREIIYETTTQGDTPSLRFYLIRYYLEPRSVESGAIQKGAPVKIHLYEVWIILSVSSGVVQVKTKLPKLLWYEKRQT